MGNVQVTIDYSFINCVLEYLERPREDTFHVIVSNEAAKDVHAHAYRFHNTTLDNQDFWRKILKSESNKGKEHLEKIRKNLEYITIHDKEFLEAFDEVSTYLPDELELNTKLHLMIGYDMGIVFGSNAFLNAGHSFFFENKRELLYLAMHEVHHVGYAHYNPTYSFDSINNIKDFLPIIKYSTHLEGLAVYCPLQRRLRENGLKHRDYPVLLDKMEKERLVRKYFEIVAEIERSEDREIVEKDWDLLRQMSDIYRLWYITGAHMAQVIDEKLGREKLIQTIIDGPERYYQTYLSLERKLKKTPSFL